MTIEVLVNGAGWVDIPDSPPELDRASEPWTPREDRIAAVLQGKYTTEKIGWALRRTARGVANRLRKAAA